MPTILDLLFFLALSFLFCHELDAIQRHEWRLFAFLNRFEDQTAYRIFTLAHLPLFLLFLWFVARPNFLFFVLVDAFVLIHLGLHGWFRRHPNYEFEGWISNLFIVGAAVAGGIHLLLLLTANG